MAKTEPFEAARYLANPQAQADLLNDALASGDAPYIAQALGVIARAGHDRGGARPPRGARRTSGECPKQPPPGRSRVRDFHPWPAHLGATVVGNSFRRCSVPAGGRKLDGMLRWHP